MLAELGARDIEMWRAWRAAQPRGDERGDYHAALTAAELANVAAAFVGGKFVTVESVKDDLRKRWTPDKRTPADRAKRKAAKKQEARKRVRKKMETMREGFKAMDAEREKKRKRKG